MFTNDLQEIRLNYVVQLSRSALGYLKTGLLVFHENRRLGYYGNQQVAVGNLAISIELILKCFIAKKNIILLFKGLPLEARLLLSCPAELPRSFNPKIFEIDFRSGNYTTIELDECIAISPY